MVEKLVENAELAIRVLGPESQINFGFNIESVRWLEGYIERLRSSGQLDDANIKEGLISVLGSFLGECIIRCYGGRWEEKNGNWAVVFGQQNAAYPFTKVEKQMRNGREDSIASFYDAIPLLFKECKKPPRQSTNKHWWKFW